MRALLTARAGKETSAPGVPSAKWLEFGWRILREHEGIVSGCEVKEGDLGLFETGAIVFHIAERHAGLLPDDANARARAITWMFAALSTVEPPILELGTARLLEGDKSWCAERMPLVEDRVRNRLGQLSCRLGDADWPESAFSAGDLMMVSVLLRLKASGMPDEYPNLSAYVARGEARPAYKRAFDAQLAVNIRRNGLFPIEDGAHQGSNLGPAD